MRASILAASGIAVASLLLGCSTAGPGLANHPLDCAMGVRWADCLPGTAGYNNGGGQQIRAAQLRQDDAHIKEQFENAESECKAELQASALDPIRHKVELYKNDWDAAPPFEIASNDTFPTEAERVAIARYGTLRDACIARHDAIPFVPPSANAYQADWRRRDRAIFTEANADIGQLLVALYEGKLTYGEFASKRYDMTHAAMNADRELRRAAVISDANRRLEAQRLAQQEYDNKLKAWAIYTQAVNARQPQTVHLNCTSQQIGSTAYTNCN